MNKKTIFIIITIMLIIPGMSLLSDGFIIIKRPHGIRHQNPFPLEVSYHNVKVKIDGRVSTTYIDQEFYNPTRHRLEGTYLFPIPKGAVIKKFSMFINGRETEAELLNAAKAKKIYEDIVRRLKDPALLEYSKNGLFKARIYPIEPYSKKRVKISYTEILDMDNSIIEYLYPLNTEKFSSKPLKNVSINVSVRSENNIRTVYSPTHNISIKRSNRRSADILYRDKHIKPDRDFKLYFDTGINEMGMMLKTYKKKRGYFFLSLSPEFVNSNIEIIPKDIVFVLDVSGSMAGKKLKQAKKALKFCVENLNKNDRFNIIKFSTEAELLFDNLSNVNKKKLKISKEFIDQLRAIGGTNIEEALSMALKMKTGMKRPFTIMFLTDGKPTIGETDENRLLKLINRENKDKVRIFTFGIGNEINTHLLDKITKSSRAFRTYISPDEDIEIKVSNFYTKIQSPILTNLKLEFKGSIRVSKMYPKQLPDMFKGSSISVFGEYSGYGKTNVILKGNMGGERKSYKFNKYFTDQNTENDFIPQLWATRRIGYILDQIRLNGENKELKDEIVSLAKKYGVLTPYTSYLIVEDEKARVVRREIHHRDQLLVPVIGGNKKYIKESKKDRDNMKLKTGMGSVRMSSEAQSLNRASNYAQKKPAKSRMNFSDMDGKNINLTNQFKNIQGRAIYNTGKFWIDSKLQTKKKKDLKVDKIQFLSKKYFELLNKSPEVSEFLALGQNVRFIFKNIEYEIYE